jgi:DNA polymerase-3 subunit epsilon
VAVADGKVRPGDSHYQLIRPRHMPGPETTRIHGLLESDLAAAPPLDQVLDDLLRAISDRPLVAHVAPVEQGFLGAALATRGLELANPMIDTAALARELRSRSRLAIGTRRGPPIGLGDLARSLGLPVHRPHHADGDALTTAQVFIALATHLDVSKAQTVASLARPKL